MYYLSIDTMLSAAHFLRGYDGNCSKIHGHNWKIRITVKTDQLNDIGIGLDFNEIKELSWQIFKSYDHLCINDVPPFDKINPTAENLARHFYEQIDKLLPAHVKMHKISLWETENFLVEYKA